MSDKYTLAIKSRIFPTINHPSHYLTELHKIILIFLEKAGSGMSKEVELKYIQAWKNLTSCISLEVFI